MFEKNFSIDNRDIKKEKPPALYHASANRDITEFEPRANSIRNPNEGPLVFATPDIKRAIRFLVPVNESWTQISSFNNLHIIVISDKERFLALDKGGAIYTLSPENFELENDEHKDEWTSKTKVKPSSKIQFDSALEAMLNHSVQVYFVSPEILEAIRSSKDHGLSILREQKSENERLEKNFIKLPIDEVN